MSTIAAKKVAELNAIETIIRDWQSGSISQRQMASRLGNHLTQEQIDTITPRLYRTIDRAYLAKIIAEVIGM